MVMTIESMVTGDKSIGLPLGVYVENLIGTCPQAKDPV